MLNNAIQNSPNRLRSHFLMPLLAWVFFVCPAQSGILYEQVPEHDGGYASDILPPHSVSPLIAVAEDFLLNQAATIKNVTWWGELYIGMPIPGADDFTIRFFGDDGGKPGDLLRDFSIGNSASRTVDFVRPGPPDPITGFPSADVLTFKYSICFETGFLAQANTKYWLSIMNALTDDEWLWGHSMTPGVGFEIQRSFADPVLGPWQPFVDALGTPLGNAAFQLNDAEICPEPTSIAMFGVGALGLIVAARRRKQTKLKA